MNAVIKAGVALAVLVDVISIALIATGLLTSNPIVGGLVFLVLAITVTVGCIFWGLKQTAEDNGYLKQLLNGLLIGVVAGVLIFGLSMLNLTVLFPDYLEESKTASIEMFESMNMPEQVLEQQVDKIEGQTAVKQAVNGTIGTIVTSLIFGAIIAIFKRKK